jgi:hypothetical protein
MPWCDTCSRFYNPNSLPATGDCPTCGRTLAPARGDGSPARAEKAPWHLKLLVGAAAVYLGWRLVQGVEWVLHQW